MNSNAKNNVTTERKIIAKHILGIFGGKPKVQAYDHDNEALSIDVISCDDKPEDDISSYGTIGLFEHQMIGSGTEFPTRIELLGAAPKNKKHYPNIIASIAFCIMRSNNIYSPGNFFPDYIKEYYPKTTTPHAYLVDPFLWADGDFPEVIINKIITVNFLQVIGITEKELQHLKDSGEDQLNTILQEKEINVFDYQRISAV